MPANAAKHRFERLRRDARRPFRMVHAARDRTAVHVRLARPHDRDPLFRRLRPALPHLSQRRSGLAARPASRAFRAGRAEVPQKPGQLAGRSGLHRRRAEPVPGPGRGLRRGARTGFPGQAGHQRHAARGRRAAAGRGAGRSGGRGREGTVGQVPGTDRRRRDGHGRARAADPCFRSGQSQTGRLPFPDHPRPGPGRRGRGRGGFPHSRRTAACLPAVRRAETHRQQERTCPERSSNATA